MKTLKRKLPVDPLIDEVRAVKRRVSSQFGDDIEKLCDHLQQKQQQFASRLVRRSAPKRSIGKG